MDLSLWWDALPPYNKVFWCSAIPATVILLLHTLLTFIGLGGDVDGDGDIDSDFPILTLRNFEAFFAMFGWGGLVAIENGASQWIATIVGLVLGISFALIMTLLMKAMIKMQRSGTSDPFSVIGKEATVYLAIPATGSGFGKINVEIDGIVRERKAMSNGPRIEAGEQVILKSYINNIYGVERG